jgi:cobalt-zinc-cadmium efflux system outer membrane protein
VIKTGNKLELAGAAATMDLFNAQLALRRARLDVAYQVRSGYFNLLVAQENVKLSRAFARFTDEIYAAQIGLLKGKEAAAYEPMQLRPLALQARFNLIQAINQYRASWRQLAASMGLPDMPPSEVTGRVDLPVPHFDYEQAKSRIVSRHTDVLTAQNNIHKADYLLRLARIQPIPDVDVHLLIQKDYTTPPNNTVHSIAVTVPVPVWDQNQGAIQQAQWLWMQAMQNLPAARNTLVSSLADAYNRYSTTKKQVEIALAQTKDQVRVYKAVYTRFRGGDLAVTFGDVVAAQQTLAGYLTGYISALGLQWTAVVDMANLLQTDDLFKGTTGKDDPDLPPLEELESMLHCPHAAHTASPASPLRARLQGPVNSPETNRISRGKDSGLD